MQSGVLVTTPICRKIDMNISIRTPQKQKILDAGIEVSVARRNTSWSELCLGSDRTARGVYVIHHNGNIKYVGKTSGKKMSFGIRLRRHFQETAAGKHTYPRLVELANKQHPIMVSLFPLENIKSHLKLRATNQTPSDLISLFESALIIALDQEFQRDEVDKSA
jgi:hypothetical protein